MTADFPELLLKETCVASGSFCRRYVGLSKYEVKSPGGLHNTKIKENKFQIPLQLCAKERSLRGF